jgi:hypothetical protein
MRVALIENEKDLENDLRDLVSMDITGRCYIVLLFIGRRTMGTKSAINKQGTIAVRCGAKPSVIRHAVSIRSTQTAKRTNRAIECVALCIHTPSGF